MEKRKFSTPFKIRLVKERKPGHKSSQICKEHNTTRDMISSLEERSSLRIRETLLREEYYDR